MEYCGVNGAVAPGVGIGTGLISSVTRWCEFVQGTVQADDFLASIATSTGAGAVGLCRISHLNGGSSDGIVLDVCANSIGTPKIDRTYSYDILGELAEVASPGTVWFGSMTAGGHTPALKAIWQRRGWNELAIIPLSQSRSGMDALEFHFDRSTDPNYQAIFNMIASPFSESWAGRKKGLFEDLLHAKSIRSPNKKTTLIPLLACENPAKLSRAEFRVCLLLSQGLVNERIMVELDISQATLRTHLRNIYAKTGALGHSDLIYQLLSFAPQSHDAFKKDVS